MMKSQAVGFLLLALFWSPAAGLTDGEVETLEFLRTAVSTSLAETSWRSKTDYVAVIKGGSIEGLTQDIIFNIVMNHSVRAREDINSGFDVHTKEVVILQGDLPLTIILEVSRQTADDDANPWIRFDMAGDPALEAAAVSLGIPSGWIRLTKAVEVEATRQMISWAVLFNKPAFALNATALDESNDRIAEVTELGSEVVDGVETRVISVKAFPNTIDVETLANLSVEAALERANELAVAPTLMSLDILPERSQEPIETKYWVDSENQWLVKLATMSKVISSVLPPEEGDLKWTFFDYNEPIEIAGPR